MTLHYKLETIKGVEQPVLTGSVGVRNMKADQTGHSAAQFSPTVLRHLHACVSSKRSGF